VRADIGPLAVDGRMERSDRRSHRRRGSRTRSCEFHPSRSEAEDRLRVLTGVCPRSAKVFSNAPRLSWRRWVSGDNGSAFFFRLPLRAQSAMAEILVSDFCDDRPGQRPDAGNGGRAFAFAPQMRRRSVRLAAANAPGGPLVAANVGKNEK